ncbi:MAG: hypothetical protein AAGG47_16575 [Pseudomonadota bacterium]
MTLSEPLPLPGPLPVPLAQWPRGVGYRAVLETARQAIADEGQPADYRVAGFEAWISPGVEGALPWLSLPVRAILEHEPTGRVHASGRPLSVTGAKDLAGFAMAPPDWLAPEALGALMAACGFDAVREPGFADRVFLMPAFLGFGYEDATETLAALPVGAEGASLLPAARRVLSAVLLPGATGFECARDFDVLAAHIGADLNQPLRFEGISWP